MDRNRLHEILVTFSCVSTTARPGQGKNSALSYPPRRSLDASLPLKLIDEPLGSINSEHTRRQGSPSELTLMEGRAEAKVLVMRTGKPCLSNVECKDVVSVAKLNMVPFGTPKGPSECVTARALGGLFWKDWKQ